jgi:hypothetical protein
MSATHLIHRHVNMPIGTDRKVDKLMLLSRDLSIGPIASVGAHVSMVFSNHVFEIHPSTAPSTPQRHCEGWRNVYLLRSDSLGQPFITYKFWTNNSYM